MDSKNIYYIKVEFTIESQQYITGIRNPLCLVVADNEDEAIKLMKNFLNAKEAIAAVSIPDDATAEVGHGLSVKEYLQDPKHCNMNWREIIDAYKDRYCRYDLQILDERGEIIWQNAYTHPENFPEPPEPLKNKYVPIYTEDADKLDSGIAFVADETAEDSQAYVLTAEKIIADDGTVTIKQCRFKADGSFETRESVDGVWTEWEHVYTEEAPEDGVEYVRRNAAWKAIKYDNTPTANSKNLVDSGHIKTYVEEKVAKLYKYRGSVNTLSDLPTTGLVIGDTYNIKQKSSLTMTVSGSSMLIQADAGDNVVWNGTYWDNLSGFVDVDAIKDYVDNAVAEVIDNKADKSTTLSGYGITDAYTKGEIDSKISNMYEIKGSSTIANLPTNPEVGDVYNITDSGTITGTEIVLSAGDNVVYTLDGWDKLAATVDLSGYQEKLIFDTTPTEGSTNPVTSGGIKEYIIEATAEDIDNWIGNSDTTSVVGEATAGNAIVGI